MGVSAVNLLGAAGSAIALLGALAWVGGLCWQIVILLRPSWSTGIADERGIIATARSQAIARFESDLWWLLGAALVGDLILLLANSLQAGATLSDGLRVLLTHGQFGTYWFMRQIAVLATLLVLVLFPFAGLPVAHVSTAHTVPSKLPAPGKSERGKPDALSIIRASEQRLLHRDLIALALGIVFLIALMLSGPLANLGAVSLAFDLLHLLATSAWVGGTLYLTFALAPSLRRTAPEERARELIALAPRAVPLAIGSVALLALTGGITTSARLATSDQLFTTLYGRVLSLKIVLVALSIILGAWFLSNALPAVRRSLERERELTRAGLGRGKLARSLSDQLAVLMTRCAAVVRWSAALAVGTIISTALLGVLGGTLVSGYHATGQSLALHVTTDAGHTFTATLDPARRGTATLTLHLTAPADSITATATMLDMPMGTQPVTLTASSDGLTFTGPVEILMRGRWAIALALTTPDGAASRQENVTFTIDVES